MGPARSPLAAARTNASIRRAYWSTAGNVTRSASGCSNARLVSTTISEGSSAGGFQAVGTSRCPRVPSSTARCIGAISMQHVNVACPRGNSSTPLVSRSTPVCGSRAARAVTTVGSDSKQNRLTVTG